jgi:hypothetical protein
MLRITIELVPLGVEANKKTLVVGTIVNDGTGTHTTGNYRVTLQNAAGRKWKAGTIVDFPRTRLLAWDLLYRCLAKLVGKRNIDVKTVPCEKIDSTL